MELGQAAAQPEGGVPGGGSGLRKDRREIAVHDVGRGGASHQGGRRSGEGLGFRLPAAGGNHRDAGVGEDTAGQSVGLPDRLLRRPYGGQAVGDRPGSAIRSGSCGRGRHHPGEEARQAETDHPAGSADAVLEGGSGRLDEETRQRQDAVLQGRRPGDHARARR